MIPCVFASDLHGDVGRYEKLFHVLAVERPRALFLGGDLLPGALADAVGGGDTPDFVRDFLAGELEKLRERVGPAYPRVFVILGNDDGRVEEAEIERLAERGLVSYVHDRHVGFAGFEVYGYACVPPTPFMLKDWERYDVSRYVEPGCVSPEEGRRSFPLPEREARFSTIQQDLERLAGAAVLERAVFLFHAPPYGTRLDRAALDGRKVDHVPLDVHVGSVAIRRFIEERQPWLCLHGHVHESARLTGAWRDALGRTVLLGAAHDGPELALVVFDLERPAEAERRLI